MQSQTAACRHRLIRNTLGVSLATVTFLLHSTLVWSQEKDVRETFRAFAVSMGTMATGANTTLQITVDRWSTDEERVTWFHPVEEGFAGRQPIPEELLETE